MTTNYPHEDLVDLIRSHPLILFISIIFIFFLTYSLVIGVYSSIDFETNFERYCDIMYSNGTMVKGGGNNVCVKVLKVRQ